MKDIHLKINPTIELFNRGCALNRIHHYYEGHSHFDGGIDLTFKVLNINTEFFQGLQLHFDHFTIRNERGNVEVVVRIFEDTNMPF